MIRIEEPDLKRGGPTKHLELLHGWSQPDSFVLKALLRSEAVAAEDIYCGQPTSSGSSAMEARSEPATNYVAKRCII